MNQKPLISIIIPVYNGGKLFQRCLDSIKTNAFSNWELLVIDDNSTDASAEIAQSFGATVLHTPARMGPASARNLGAQQARGKILFFVDADCELYPNTLSIIAQTFQTAPHLSALFGAYDDAPGAKNFIAQYKNLFHHYVHQQGKPEANTFWTGCGAIKRDLFLALGGFDAKRYRRPAIEDIDLGYRLKQNGGHIRLVKTLQVKHNKAWTLTSLLKSDIFDRGIPWTRLILRDKAFANDLNLQTHNRVSVMAVYALCLALLISPFSGWGWLIVAGLAGLLLWLNRHLYHFFHKKRGLIFALRVIPLHWLYYCYNGLSFGMGLILYSCDRVLTRPYPPPKPLPDLSVQRE